MKIQQLFTELEKVTENEQDAFKISGIKNLYNEMRFGFFPLGWGILTENNKTTGKVPTTEIEEGGVMVLGNDFGTLRYVKNYVDNPEKQIGETDSKTINNLLNQKVGLNVNNTFFTNFYLGVRTHKDATMIKRIEGLNDDYKNLCFEFFITQLNFLNPRTVICLGHDVKNALIDSAKSELFTRWKPKSITMKKLYSDNENNYVIDVIESKEFGSRKFIVIPHPCDLRNFKALHMEKLNHIVNN